MTEEVTEITSLFQTLASCRPDTLPQKKRLEIVESAESLLIEDADCRLALSKLVDLKCSTIAAYKRLAHCFCVAIRAAEEGLETSDLVTGLVQLLEKASDANLIEECAQELDEYSDIVVPILLSFDKKLTVPAVALGYRLDTSQDWWTILFQYATTNFPTNMYLTQALVESKRSEWDSVSPQLQLKLKSHPEKTIDMLLHSHFLGMGPPDEAWMQLLCKNLQNDLRDKTVQLIVQWTAVLPNHVALLATSVATTPAPTVPTRAAIYKCLDQLSQHYLHPDEKNATIDTSSVLKGLIELIKKDVKPEHRLPGQTALAEWWVRMPTQNDLMVPVFQKFMTTKTDTAQIFRLFVERVDPDNLSKLIALLWSNDFEKYLTSLVTSVKRATQMEALIAIYFGLLYASVTGKPIPTYCEKVITNKTSFMYLDAMMDGAMTNSAISTTLPRVLSLFVELNKIKSGGVFKGKAMARAMACAAMAPASSQTKKSSSVLVSIESILKHENRAAEPLIRNLIRQINTVSIHAESTQGGLFTAGQASKQEEQTETNTKQQGSDNETDLVVDGNMVRRVARLLLPHLSDVILLTHALVMMHAGSSLQNEGHQRTALILNTKHAIRTHILPLESTEFRESMGDEIVRLCCEESFETATEERQTTGVLVRQAAASLLLSLGDVASNFSEDTDNPSDDETKEFLFASRVCVSNIAPRLAQSLDKLLDDVIIIPDGDIEIALSAMGTLVQVSSDTVLHKREGRKHLTEDQAWEEQMRKELAEKKKASDTASPEFSLDEKRLIGEQDLKRRSISTLLFGSLMRTLDCIHHLVSSSIETGNKCLPALTKPVIQTAVIDAPALCVKVVKDKAFRTLESLAMCVYEIHDMHAPTIAQALITAYSTPESDVPTRVITKNLAVSPLPSPCASAACVIYEIEDFHDVLSGPSFAFLFPVLHAALAGPRTPPGCEHALKIVGKHADLMGNDDSHPCFNNLRKDLAVSVLELLKYDRSQTFQDPSAPEVLVSCYSSKGILGGDLLPLLDERGALGTTNCRKGSMMALKEVIRQNPEVLTGNPLVENRVWLCSFDEDEDVRAHAREAWTAAHQPVDAQFLAAPSPLYAATLVPLLSNCNDSIAVAAANAYAVAMGLHKTSIGRNIETLCKSYIEAFPSSGDDITAAPKAPESLFPSPLLPMSKTKPLSTGLPKKTTIKKSALDVAGIGRPKISKTKKTSALTSAMLKPKQERTLDQVELQSQFVKGTVKVKDEEDSPEKIVIRQGILRALMASTKPEHGVTMDEKTLQTLTGFLIAFGIADTNEVIQGKARDTLREVVASNGSSEQAIRFLLPFFESVLKNGNADEKVLGSLPVDKLPRKIDASDRRKEGAVVALGSVALHLKGPDSDSKVDSTVDMLVDALKTPSEGVQASVADALTKLMKKGKTQDRVEALLNKLMHDCLYDESLAVRRGAAYGLAAAVKGSGIAVLKKYGIVSRLEQASAEGSPSSKEGSLFAVELLSGRLGLLFEPYVIVLLPSLLKSFSDGSDHVRQAASSASSVIMSKLSAHGVKLVLPAVLQAFDEPAWRTKQASIHMLGAMSHLAPKQLASALPKVVPKLTEAFSDTHSKVKTSAQEALDEISTVVKNPEISSISSVLLKALTDPADHTSRALECLIATEFLHAIDAPSLALIVPILHRGLRDRGASNKRFGGLIAGNICTMINDPKDFVPYLPILLPDLQAALLDPIPDVRGTSAKALGSLTRSLGDYVLPELRPWLLKKLRDYSCSSAERSGAAQGLCEVLIASGSSNVEETMREEVIPLSNHPEASTREGVLWMLAFLAPAMGQNFTPLLDKSLPAIISGLSDDAEPVRDVSMRAGRVIIRTLGKQHADKILPALEDGLLDDDYRIRVASLSLLGDELSTIGGTQMIKGDSNTQDDIRRAERAQAQIALVLGPDTRRRVLSELYLARSDSAHAVRQSAIQVWKTVVSVTGRTLREILPTLVNKIIENLASGDEERTILAGRCLGDVVSKLGDSVLPQIIPVLRNALYDGDANTKKGVCVGLSEIIKTSTKEQIVRFIEIIVRVVQDALSDDDEGVRQMASTSFQSLFGVVGTRAFDEIVPSFTLALESEDAVSRSRALHGLTGILAVRSRELLPYIIPRLLSRPVTIHHADALTGVFKVTGSTMQPHISMIVPTILLELSEMDNDVEAERNEAIRRSSSALCASVDMVTVNTLVREISSKCGSDKASIRRESCFMFESLITGRASMQDFYEMLPVMMREFLYRLNDDDTQVLQANHRALTALASHVPAEELVKHIEFMRNLLASIVSDARRRKGGVGDGEFLLPGFNMPKGLEPLLPIYQRGILYGSPTIREVSATGLGEALDLTASKFLAGPLLVKITGPLLRIVGDRNPSNVKISILRTLGLILMKGGPALRAFVPQFQTTFVKALSDPSRQVRVEAITALALLMPLSTRVDPLIKELVGGALGHNINVEGQSAIIAVQTATLGALATVLANGGEKAKLPASIPSALDAAKELLEHPNDGIRSAAGKVLGAACELLGNDVTQEVLVEILDRSNANSVTRHGKGCAIRRIFQSKIGKDYQELLVKANSLILTYLHDEDQLVREAACLAIGPVIASSTDPKKSMKECEPAITEILNDKKELLEIHKAMASGLVLALQMIEPTSRINTLGLTILGSCLQQAMGGIQRVQYAFNDVLWLALDVEHGSSGMDRYASAAMFESVKTMRSLYTKVLTKIKKVTLIED